MLTEIKIENNACFTLPPHEIGLVFDLIVGCADIRTRDAQIIFPHFTKEEMPEINRIRMRATADEHGTPYWVAEPSP